MSKLERKVESFAQEVREMFEDMKSGAITFLDDRPIQISQDSKRRDEITLFADSANTGTVYFGSVDSQIVPLAKGTSFPIKKSALSKIWVKDSTSSDKVYFFTGGA